eukprot:jgi/Psemu1/300131/fgenesh1_kg.6_\
MGTRSKTIHSRAGGVGEKSTSSLTLPTHDPSSVSWKSLIMVIDILIFDCEPTWSVGCLGSLGAEGILCKLLLLYQDSLVESFIANTFSCFLPLFPCHYFLPAPI